jgi:hypothetical protein
VTVGLYFTVTVVYAATHQILGSIPFLLLFQTGFLYTGVLSLWESVELKALRAAAARQALDLINMAG